MAKPRFLMRNDEVNTANEEVIIDETVTPMEDVQKDTANEVEVDNKETSENKVDVIEPKIEDETPVLKEGVEGEIKDESETVEESEEDEKPTNEVADVIEDKVTVEEPKTELPIHKETENEIEDESEKLGELEDTKVEDDKATVTDVEDGLVDKPTVNEVPKEVSPIEGNITEEVVNEETTGELKENKPKEDVAEVNEQEDEKNGKVTIDEVKIIDDAEKEKIVNEVTDKVIEGMKDKDKEGIKDEIKDAVKEIVDEIIKEKQDKTKEEIKDEAKEIVDEVVEEKPKKVEPNPTSKDYPRWKDKFLRNWATVQQLRKVCNLKKITPPEFEYLTDEKY